MTVILLDDGARRQGRILAGGGIFAGGITFTRASSATIWDGSTYATVGNDVPRWLPSGRLLIEGTRTNLFLNSAVLSTQNVTAAATTYTVSFAGTGSITLAGTATGTLNGTGANNIVQTSVVATAGLVTVAVTGDVRFANFEAGAFATSWIPTTGATAVRALELPTGTLAGMNIPSGGFTLVGRLYPPQTTIGFPFQVDQGSNPNRYFLSGGAGTLIPSRTLAGAGSTTTSAGTIVAGQSFGFASAIDAPNGRMATSMDAGTVRTITGGPTSLTNLTIGAAINGSSQINGEMSLFVLPYIVSDAALPALSLLA